MRRQFKYLDKLINGSVSTRERSAKQEKRIAKEIGGRTTINSGATFGENDVISEDYEVEAKTTSKESYSISLSDWRKLKKKCSMCKVPVMVVDFEGTKNSLAIMSYDDFLQLVNR